MNKVNVYPVGSEALQTSGADPHPSMDVSGIHSLILDRLHKLARLTCRELGGPFVLTCASRT